MRGDEMINVRGLLTRLSGFGLMHNPPIEPMVITTRDGKVILLEALLADAGIKIRYDEVCGHATTGVVMIADPKTAAKLENDAEILDLGRRLINERRSLVGKYIKIGYTDHPGSEGEIYIVGAEVLKYGMDRKEAVELHCGSLFDNGLLLVVADNQAEAEKIFNDRRAAMQAIGAVHSPN